MAAIEDRSAPVQVLTGLALALLSAAPTPAVAQEADSFSVQVGRYEESARDILGLRAQFDPIAVDTIHASASYSPDDRLRVTVNFSQDTWSGATPIAIAPVVVGANNDTVSGASPFITAPGLVYLDQATLAPLELDEFSEPTGRLDPRVVHTMSGATPEARGQIDVGVSRENNDSVWRFGAGLSHEHDYESVFGSVGGRWDFNRKATTLNAGLSFTQSDINTILKHETADFVYDACRALCDPVASSIDPLPNGDRRIRGGRQDWTSTLGVTQVLDRESVVEVSAGFARAQGYLAHPYKVVEVFFVDPELQFLAPAGAYFVSMTPLVERRPEERNQGTLDLRYVRHINLAGAGLHLGYRFYADDWGVDAHTFDVKWAQPLGDGWMVTPRLRYYSQSAAAFYTHHMVTFQGERPRLINPVRGQAYGDSADLSNPANYFDEPNVANPDGINPISGEPVVDADGNPVSQAIASRLFIRRTAMDRALLPTHYSSDARLSAFGALSVGISVSKQLTSRARFELSYEHYTHAGNLRFGGGGEADFADFDYDLVSASLRFALTPDPR